MTNRIYKPFENLESFATHAASLIGKGQRYLNFFVSAELPVQAIQNMPLKDVTEKAKKWRAKERPDDLFINHGEFIGKGLSHIIEELNSKQTSNRALYSLISEKHIIDQGDKPIPSFMIFQCTVEDEILYCTVYFRALEIANFFRINLEEIRLNLCDILKKIPFSQVRLTVLAFSAYNKPEQIPLERCQLDLMTGLKISDLYDTTPDKIPELLDIKANETTVVDTTGLLAIKEWLAPERESKWPRKLKVQKIISTIDQAISAATELHDLRCSNSHHNLVDQASEKYVKTIKKVAEAFRQ